MRDRGEAGHPADISLLGLYLLFVLNKHSPMGKKKTFYQFNPRRCIPCRTRFKTAIAAARPFLGLCPSPLLWLKALDALYNFPAAGKVVGGKPGAR